jgi:hypothetical protein
MGDGDADLPGIRSEHDFMDALRVLKARSGLSYRDIVARMSRADPRHASARSTLADLLAGNSLPRRPGQLRLLVEVLAAELNEPGQADRYMQAWSRLIAARGDAQLHAVPTTPVVSVFSQPATRPGTSVLPGRASRPGTSVLPGRASRPATGSAPLYVYPADPPGSSPAPADQASSRGRPGAVFLIWLVLSMAFYPATYVIGWLFWLIWAAFAIPLLLILYGAREHGRRPGSLGAAPGEYLRMEYRASGPAVPSGVAGRWPG